jgi:hypothetical protein
MRLTDDELKAEMKAKAEAAVEKLFAEKKGPNDIKLSDIEQAVYEAGEAIKANLTAGLVKQIITETGAVTVERAYYYCETCRSGLFPPG